VPVGAKLKLMVKSNKSGVALGYKNNGTNLKEWCFSLMKYAITNYYSGTVTG